MRHQLCSHAPAKACASLRHHHFHKLLIVDLSVTINISLADHFVNFLICKLLTQVGHHMTELSCANETVAIAIEDLEGFDEFLLCVSVLHLPCHKRQELWEVGCAIAVCINLVDHVLQFCLSWVLSQGA